MPFLTIAKSGTLDSNEKWNELARAGRRIYRLGFGESPFPVPQTVQAALRGAAARTDYTAVAGLPELRERIAAFHHEADGYPIRADQVLVAPGTKPLIYSLMHAFSPCEFYAPGPSWVSYGPQAATAGHKVNRIATSFETRWRVTPEALEEAIARKGTPGADKLMALNYPGNPDGLTYTRSELQALTEVLRRHEVWVIADEIYALLDHSGAHVSLAGIYPERTLVTTGLSKWCGAGGWRLGALILPPSAPSALRDALLGLASEIYSCAPAPIQVAALSAYDLRADIQEHLGAQRRVLRAVGMAVYRALAAAGLRVHAPQGGFYLLPDFSPHRQLLAQRGIFNDRQLCDRLLDELGVALLHGSAFGVAPESLTARLAYVDFDGGAALAQAKVGDAGLEVFAERMLEAISAVGTWLR